jgi:alkyl sulfatase BDS1-like metallo-beta-lactamase superfamily hydrolase
MARHLPDAARELREGIIPAHFSTVAPDMILAMPIDILFDFAAVHLAGDRAADADIRLDLTFTDLNETWHVWVRHGVLNARPGASADPQLTVSGAKAALVGVVLAPAGADALAQAGKITLDGDPSVLKEFAALMDQFDPNFSIVTP